jgi:hypothetical protein
MYEAAASCKDIARALISYWERQCVTLAGYCYTVRHGMKFQLLTPYRVNHLQVYGVMVRGNVTSVYQPLEYQTSVSIRTPGPLPVLPALICVPSHVVCTDGVSQPAGRDCWLRET